MYNVFKNYFEDVSNEQIQKEVENYLHEQKDNLKKETNDYLDLEIISENNIHKLLVKPYNGNATEIANIIYNYDKAIIRNVYNKNEVDSPKDIGNIQTKLNAHIFKDEDIKSVIRYLYFQCSNK